MPKASFQSIAKCDMCACSECLVRFCSIQYVALSMVCYHWSTCTTSIAAIVPGWNSSDHVFQARPIFSVGIPSSNLPNNCHLLHYHLLSIGNSFVFDQFAWPPIWTAGVQRYNRWVLRIVLNWPRSTFQLCWAAFPSIPLIWLQFCQ
jgi:hypothetical protein